MKFLKIAAAALMVCGASAASAQERTAAEFAKVAMEHLVTLPFFNGDLSETKKYEAAFASEKARQQFIKAFEVGQKDPQTAGKSMTMAKFTMNSPHSTGFGTYNGVRGDAYNFTLDWTRGGMGSKYGYEIYVRKSEREDTDYEIVGACSRDLETERSCRALDAVY